MMNKVHTWRQIERTEQRQQSIRKNLAVSRDWPFRIAHNRWRPLPFRSRRSSDVKVVAAVDSTLDDCCRDLSTSRSRYHSFDNSSVKGRSQITYGAINRQTQCLIVLPMCAL